MLYPISILILLNLFLCSNGCSIASTQKAPNHHTSEIKIAEEENKIGSTAGLKIAYIANMGVLIEQDTHTVLIDGFHEQYKAAYQYPTKETVDDLIKGEYPQFSKIELNLVTHKHKDHYSPSYTLAFLRSNQHALTIGSRQIKKEVANLIEKGEAHLLDRIKVVDFDYKVQETLYHGIKLQSVRCDHSNQARHKEIENIAYLIDLNGYRILHLGDSSWDLAEKAFDLLKLSTIKVDIAILPDWMLMESSSKSKMLQFIQAHQIIATHINPRYANKVKEHLNRNFENLRSFTNLGEVFFYEK